ncbi:Retrotransposon gag domain [Sesbania bispinosa]|nr:Retrotransposon gag domain [Sesbania bispinosa]
MLRQILESLSEFHPFSTEIAETQFPADFREPILKDYDGTTDPQVHVTTFKTQMLKKGVSDALQCKLFSGTLAGSALIWYSNLPPLSINSVQDFLKKFLVQFSARRSRKMTSGKLFSVRQKAGEQLREFLGRFNEASLLVINPNPELLVSAFKEGLLSGPFNESLAQRPTASMEEIRNRRENKWWEDRPGHKKNTFNSTHFAGRQGRGFNTNEDRQKGTAWNEGKYKHRLPPPVEGVKGPDLDKWCDYHRAKGHDTENCWTLMNKIKKLIKDGFLGRYVEKRRSTKGTRDEGGSSGRGNYNKRKREDNRCDEKEEPKEIRGVVTMIVGGFCGGGETSSARRKYVRSVMSVSVDISDKKECRSLVISFSDEDMKGVIQ